MKSPHTYAEWVNILTILKNRTDDEEVLCAMQSGTIEWQSGVAERFSKRLIDTVNFRLNAAADRFQKEITRSQGQESGIVRAILALRKELQFLTKTLDLPALPERERQHYTSLVLEQADSIQKSLEDSARNDRSGRLSSVIRNHKVNSFKGVN